MFGSLFLNLLNIHARTAPATVQVFGGPIPPEGGITPPFLEYAALAEGMAGTAGVQEGDALPLGDAGAVANVTNPLRGLLSAQGGILTYTVEDGDTLSQIAKNFGVSLNTILWANPDLRASRIRPGQQVFVPLVSGAVHAVGEGETLDVIAGLYGISAVRIQEANPDLPPGELHVGGKVVVPGAEPKRAAAFSYSRAGLPNLDRYFKIPTRGVNWGELHYKNAVDIANACGTPVHAAAEGLVVRAGSPNAWNDGYGGFAAIEHPNGTATTYAHMGEIAVEEGEYVKQDERIGEIGNTGNTHGVTGCHLHFEVEGARNPFAK